VLIINTAFLCLRIYSLNPDLLSSSLSSPNIIKMNPNQLNKQIPDNIITVSRFNLYVLIRKIISITDANIPDK
jgi:hypothetical protein